MKKNVLYAQSGGVTAVINASAHGLLEAAREHHSQIGTVYAGLNGILGVLQEELIDTSHESHKNLSALHHTPGGAFGSCRYKLKGLEENRREYERLIEVFKAHNIGYFFYNGGGDSQDTALKVYEMSKQMNYPLVCIGIPKTIDNDIPFTDTCPGFGSVAKYVALSTLEASIDVRSMYRTSTKVFILEVMGRHAGYIAAAAGLAGQRESDPPHLILFPELEFDPTEFCQNVERTIAQQGFCVIVASEGLKNAKGQFLAESGLKDAFGHAQLGGVASVLAQTIKEKLNVKCHYAISDYLQRSARHIASKTDLDQAYALGYQALVSALAGKTGTMMSIVRESSDPYQWHIGEVPLDQVANQEKKMPREFIREDGYGITELCRAYLRPLILGEAYPPYQQGLPNYRVLENKLVQKRLEAFDLTL